jgi:hypothetical protein
MTAAAAANSFVSAAASSAAAPHSADVADNITTQGPDGNSTDDDVDGQIVQLQVPPAPLSTVQLLQRPTSEYAKHRVVPRTVPACERACNVDNTFELHEVMLTYDHSHMTTHI